MLASLFKITETNPKAIVEMSDPLIEVGMDAKLEVKIGSYLVKGEVGLDKGAPLPLQG